MDQENRNDNGRDELSCYRYHLTNVESQKTRYYDCLQHLGWDYHGQRKCYTTIEENSRGFKILRDIDNHLTYPHTLTPLNLQTLCSLVEQSLRPSDGNEIPPEEYSELFSVYSKLHRRYGEQHPLSFRVKIRTLELSRDNFMDNVSYADKHQDRRPGWYVFRYRLSSNDPDKTKYYSCVKNKSVKCEASAIINPDGVVTCFGNHIDHPRYARDESIGGRIHHAFLRQQMPENHIAETDDRFSDLFMGIRRLFDSEKVIRQPFILQTRPVQIKGY